MTSVLRINVLEETCFMLLVYHTLPTIRFQSFKRRTLITTKPVVAASGLGTQSKNLLEPVPSATDAPQP